VFDPRGSGDPKPLWPQAAAGLRPAWTLRLRSGQAREGAGPHTSFLDFG